MFSLIPFRRNNKKIIGTFESHLKGQHSNLARRATQSCAVQPHGATLKCYAVLRYASVCAMLCYAVPR